MGASSAVKLGDIDTGGKLGEAEVGAANDGKFGDMAVVATAEVKFGEVATGAKFGDKDVEGVKFGEAGIMEVAAAMSGDTDLVGMQGRKFGDVTKESVRFVGVCDVANRADRFGEVMERLDSCLDVSSHCAWASPSI